MKKVFAILSIATVMVACNNSADSTTATKDSTSTVTVDSTTIKKDSGATTVDTVSKMKADTSKMKK
jgi:ABC-type glycerol-3-phosphate transport system substrate-binding protein